VCGTTTDVQAIVELDGKPIGTGKPGPITVRLRQALERRLYPDRVERLSHRGAEDAEDCTTGVSP
jgi:hypothetical protein